MLALFFGAKYDQIQSLMLALFFQVPSVCPSVCLDATVPVSVSVATVPVSVSGLLSQCLSRWPLSQCLSRCYCPSACLGSDCPCVCLDGHCPSVCLGSHCPSVCLDGHCPSSVVPDVGHRPSGRDAIRVSVTANEVTGQTDSRGMTTGCR